MRPRLRPAARTLASARTDARPRTRAACGRVLRLSAGRGRQHDVPVQLPAPVDPAVYALPPPPRRRAAPRHGAAHGGGADLPDRGAARVVARDFAGAGAEEDGEEMGAGAATEDGAGGARAPGPQRARARLFGMSAGLPPGQCAVACRWAPGTAEGSQCGVGGLLAGGSRAGGCARRMPRAATGGCCSGGEIGAAT
jgi:hypothetical protein